MAVSRNYTARTLKVLFGLSSHCGVPGCGQRLVKPDTDKSASLVLAQICHILAASDKGPRADRNVSARERNRPENLILLCPTHHKIIDGQHATYPPDLLRRWKATQESGSTTGLAAYRHDMPHSLAARLAEEVLFQPIPGSSPAEVAIERYVEKDLRAQGLPAILAALTAPLTALVGPSGMGKTNLLLRLALDASTLSILPLLVSCAPFESSLHDLITNEARHGFGAKFDLAELETEGGAFLLLCDDFQLCRNKRLFLEQVRALMRRNSKSKCLLFTHDLPDLEPLRSGKLPAYRICKLDDDAILQIFAGFMSPASADALYEEISMQGELDAFRSPLLAALLATAHSPIADQAWDPAQPVRRGELYRKVISEGLLRSWVARSYPDLVNPIQRNLVGYLGSVAATMLGRDVESVPRSESTGNRLGHAELEAQALASGLLRLRDGDLSFAHTAVRDYFAAEHLLGASPWRVGQHWLQPRWHGALKIFATLWEPEERRMRWIRCSGWVTLRLLTVLRVHANTYATKMFYFMLEFAAESTINEAWLQLGIYHLYCGNSVFLDHGVATPQRQFLGHTEDRLANVQRLLGKLDNEQIREWQRDANSPVIRRYRIHGIRQDKSVVGLLALLRGIGSDDDGIADYISIELAFEYPSALIREAFDIVLDDESISAPRLLNAVLHALVPGISSDPERNSGNKQRADRVLAVLTYDKAWRDLFLALALGEDKSTSEAAISVLRRFSAKAPLREDIEEIFIAALAQEVVLVRTRAAWALVWGRQANSLEGLKSLLHNDEDCDVCTAACNALLWRDSEKSSYYLWMLLRRFGKVLQGACEEAKPEIWELTRTWSRTGHKPYKKYVRWFLVFARCGAGPFERMVAVRGLAMLRGPLIAKTLLSLLRDETSPSSRFQLAEKWAFHPEVSKEEVASELLSDPFPRVRAEAARAIWQRDGNLSAAVRAMVVKAAEEDADAEVRSDMARCIRMIELAEQRASATAA